MPCTDMKNVQVYNWFRFVLFFFVENHPSNFFAHKPKTDFKLIEGGIVLD